LWHVKEGRVLFSEKRITGRGRWSGDPEPGVENCVFLRPHPINGGRGGMLKKKKKSYGSITGGFVSGRLRVSSRGAAKGGSGYKNTARSQKKGG